MITERGPKGSPRPSQQSVFPSPTPLCRPNQPLSILWAFCLHLAVNSVFFFPFSFYSLQLLNLFDFFFLLVGGGGERGVLSFHLLPHPNPTADSFFFSSRKHTHTQPTSQRNPVLLSLSPPFLRLQLSKFLRNKRRWYSSYSSE